MYVCVGVYVGAYLCVCAFVCTLVDLIVVKLDLYSLYNPAEMHWKRKNAPG